MNFCVLLKLRGKFGLKFDILTQDILKLEQRKLQMALLLKILYNAEIIEGSNDIKHLSEWHYFLRTQKENEVH